MFTQFPGDTKFDAAIIGYYKPEHRARGYIESLNRQGEPVRFPIMTLSIGVVTNTQRMFADAMQVSNLASEMKKYAKGLSGSVYRVDRRNEGVADTAGSVAADGASSSGPHATGTGR